MMEVIEDTKYLNLRDDVSYWGAAACVFQQRRYMRLISRDTGVMIVERLSCDIIWNSGTTLTGSAPWRFMFEKNYRPID